MARFFKLNTGAMIPAIGLGTYKAEPGVVEASILSAVKAGYRHIDCSPVYLNEKEIGSALKKLFQHNIVKREDLFITSKLWCSFHAPEDVPEALNITLEDLQLDYVDLYIIHWPYRLKKGGSIAPENFVSPELPTTWAAMEQLYTLGKARAIGVSNFSSKKLQDLLAVARVSPAVNQVECHPGLQQTKLHAFCQSAGIHISAYAPLARSTKVLGHHIVNLLAEKLGKTSAQVVLRWGIQSGQSVLPKSVNETRIKENLDIFDWSIPDDLFAKFSEIEQVADGPPLSVVALTTTDDTCRNAVVAVLLDLAADVGVNDVAKLSSDLIITETEADLVQLDGDAAIVPPVSVVADHLVTVVGSPSADVWPIRS